MIHLNRQLIKDLKKTDRLILPREEQFHYPEKVLQFGTGVLQDTGTELKDFFWIMKLFFSGKNQPIGFLQILYQLSIQVNHHFSFGCNQKRNDDSLE